MSASTALPKGWSWTTLGEVCAINPRRPRDLGLGPREMVTFIPMAAVDDKKAVVAEPQARPFEEVARGYTYMEEGDVIFAKITPCMQNGKHAIVRDTLSGIAFGSTEFHVLRPSAEVHPAWIHRFLLQPEFLAEAEGNFAGTAGQRRVPKEFLADAPMPLPPVAEQRHIVAELEARLVIAERALGAARAQLTALNAMAAALLRNVFEKPRAETWPLVELEDICEQERTIISWESPDYSATSYVGLEHIEADTGRILLSGEDETAVSRSNNFLFTPEHVLYGKLRPYLNKVALPDFSGRCSTEIVPLRPTRAEREWVAWILRYEGTVDYAMRETTGSRMPRTSMRHLLRMPVPLPSRSEQRRIVAELEAQVAAVERAREAAQEQHVSAAAAAGAILRGAFVPGSAS